MRKFKVLLIFGTRPEAIKMAPVVKEFQKQSQYFETLVCVTGQHREMLDQVLKLFEISPDYDLNIMQAKQDLYDVTVRVLLGVKEVLNKVNPDLVLVHGDTTTSTASALASFYKQTPVGHVEAGLRTYNHYSPWPEEMNRQLTGRIATLHFAPTLLSRSNLLQEGVSSEGVFVTGNTVIDALLWVINKIEKTQAIDDKIKSLLKEKGLENSLIDAWASMSRKLVLITGHRRESFGEGFINICMAIKELAHEHSDLDFVYPMHLNPNVRNAIKHVFGGFVNTKNVFFLEPLDYLPFVYLMKNSYLVLTDSGGIQEEAPGLGKPVLVMRNNTERPEAVSAGTVVMVGTDKEKIKNEVLRLLLDKSYYDQMSYANNPYGDGRAAEKIAQTVQDLIKNNKLIGQGNG